MPNTVTIGWLGKTATYTYDDAGRMTGLTQFNGTGTEYFFDNANRLTTLRNITASGGSTISSYTYTLDANGNRTGINQTIPIAPSVNAGSTAFTMNSRKHRLLQAGSTAFTTYEGGEDGGNFEIVTY